MKCSECGSTIYEQYQGYSGHWYCFHKDLFKLMPKSIKICDVPVGTDEYQVLWDAPIPGFCPLHRQDPPVKTVTY